MTQHKPFPMYDNAVLLLVLTMLFWGGNAIAGKLAVGHVSPLLLTAARWGVASVILLILARRYIRNDWPVIRRNLLYLFAMGAVGFTGFNGLLYIGLHYTTAINAGVLQAGMPLFVFLLNFLVFRTAPKWLQVCGFGLTLIGVVVTAAQGDLDRLLGLQFDRGAMFLFGALLAYASYSVALRAKPGLHWMSFLAVLITCAALAAVPLALFEMHTGALIWPVTPTGWAVIAFTAIFPSILGQGFFIRANELIGGNAASLFINLVPIFTALLAIVLLGETFHLYHGIALVLVIGGILIAQRLGVRD